MAAAISAAEVWRVCAETMDEVDAEGMVARSVGADSTWSELTIESGRAPVLVELFGVGGRRAERWNESGVGVVEHRTALTSAVRSSAAVAKLRGEVAARRREMSSADGIVKTALAVMAGTSGHFPELTLPGEYSRWASVGAWAASTAGEGLTYERVERQLERYYKALYRRYPGTLDRGIEVAVVTSTLYAFMIVMGLE